MANMASVAYAIEGPEKTLKVIQKAINEAVNNQEDMKYEEYQTCRNLGFTKEELDNKRLGGEISEEVEIWDGVIRFWAEERWGLQDFNEVLEQKFPDIKVYWVVEECGCEIYCTNDKEGKYFPERYWVDTCINGDYQSEYFITEGAVYTWLSEITKGKVQTPDDVENFNDGADENGLEDFIYVHEFEIVD